MMGRGIRVSLKGVWGGGAPCHRIADWVSANLGVVPVNQPMGFATLHDARLRNRARSRSFFVPFFAASRPSASCGSPCGDSLGEGPNVVGDPCRIGRHFRSHHGGRGGRLCHHGAARDTWVELALGSQCPPTHEQQHTRLTRMADSVAMGD